MILVRRPSKWWFIIIDFKDWTFARSNQSPQPQDQLNNHNDHNHNYNDITTTTSPRSLPAPARKVEPVARHEEKSRPGIKRHRNTDLGLTLVIMMIIDHGDHDDHGDPVEHGDEDDHDVGNDLAKKDQYSDIVKYWKSKHKNIFFGAIWEKTPETFYLVSLSVQCTSWPSFQCNCFFHY